MDCDLLLALGPTFPASPAPHSIYSQKHIDSRMPCDIGIAEVPDSVKTSEYRKTVVASIWNTGLFPALTDLMEHTRSTLRPSNTTYDSTGKEEDFTDAEVIEELLGRGRVTKGDVSGVRMLVAIQNGDLTADPRGVVLFDDVAPGGNIHRAVSMLHVENTDRDLFRRLLRRVSGLESGDEEKTNVVPKPATVLVTFGSLADASYSQCLTQAGFTVLSSSGADSDGTPGRTIWSLGVEQ